MRPVSRSFPSPLIQKFSPLMSLRVIYSGGRKHLSWRQRTSWEVCGISGMWMFGSMVYNRLQAKINKGPGQFNFYFLYKILKYLMKKGAPAPPAAKGKQAPPAPKAFNPDDFVTMTLPREEVIEIKQAFEIFDQDGSGIMDPAELKQAFIDLGFTGQNKFVYQILAELDEDQSGGIDFPEFLRLATAKIGEKDTRVEINKVFTAFDPNRSGKFTWMELKKVAQDLGEDLADEEIQAAFAKADLDEDGFVTAEDFYNIMTHRVYWDK